MEAGSVAVSVELTLHRGVSLETRDRYLLEGIVSRTPPRYDPDRPTVLLTELPLVLLATDDILEHVNRGSRGSPFASFSEKLARAKDYAFDDGKRTVGAVVSVDVLLVEAHLVGTPSGWAVAYHDEARRIWIPTREYRAPAIEEITRLYDLRSWHEVPERERGTAAADAVGVRARGCWDGEWLLLGDVLPGQMRYEEVRA